MKVALVEKYPKLGGTCLHWGCIPTKVILESAEILVIDDEPDVRDGLADAAIYADEHVDFAGARFEGP